MHAIANAPNNATASGRAVPRCGVTAAVIEAGMSQGVVRVRTFMLRREGS